MIRQFFAYIIIALLYVMSFLPLSLLRKIARFIGPKLLKHHCKTVDVINKNLQLSFPHYSKEQRKDFINERLAYMVQTFFEMSHVWIKPVDKILANLNNDFDNSDFESAIKSEKSVIVLVPHIGNWEMLVIYLSQFRHLTAMFQPIKQPTLNRFVLKARQRLGSILVPTSTRGVAKLKTTLQKEKGLVGMLPDQMPAKLSGGVFVPLFGKQALTMNLAHKLAVRTNAKVFMATAYQVERGFSICVTPLDNKFYSESSTESATCLNKSLEKMIMRHPTQYQWEYKRYRLQPDNEKSLYK